MNANFQQHVGKTPQLFADLIAHEPVAIAGGTLPAKPAIYVFYLDGDPVHVGRTRNLRQRIRGHVSKSHYSASFAFKRARSETGFKATYKAGEGRGTLLENPLFAEAFAKALAEIQGMSIQYLVVEDPIEQYLLELYAALELETSLSEFDTH